MSLLARMNSGPAISAVSPRRELGAYEALWLEHGASFKTLSEKFATDPTALPSDFVNHAIADARASETIAKLSKAGVSKFGVRLNLTGNYPAKLRDAKHPVELLYFQGNWDIAETRAVAVVGSREATDNGRKRAAQIARDLVANDYTVVSGLASGIDAAAHQSAIDAGGRTIAVIGTPLGVFYPRENRNLQQLIAEEHLLISQVPVLRYAAQHVPQNKLFFPERNATMSALTEATIIVEASDTSGTLTQARAAIHQGRKLFILDSCFRRNDIMWPANYEKKGAIRVRGMADILSALGDTSTLSN